MYIGENNGCGRIGPFEFLQSTQPGILPFEANAARFRGGCSLSKESMVPASPRTPRTKRSICSPRRWRPITRSNRMAIPPHSNGNGNGHGLGSFRPTLSRCRAPSRRARCFVCLRLPHAVFEGFCAAAGFEGFAVPLSVAAVAVSPVRVPLSAFVHHVDTLLTPPRGLPLFWLVPALPLTFATIQAPDLLLSCSLRGLRPQNDGATEE